MALSKEYHHVCDIKEVLQTQSVDWLPCGRYKVPQLNQSDHPNDCITRASSNGNATLEPWKLGCFAPAKALLIYFRLIRRNYGLFNAITFCVAQKSNQTGMLTWEKFDEVDVQERGATGRILWERTVLFGENKIGNVFTSCSENNLLFWGDDLNKGVHIFNIPDGSIVESIMTDAPVCGLKVYNEGTRVEVLESDECNDPSGSKSNIWVYRRTIYWYNDRHQPKETYEPKGTKEHQTRRIEEVD